MALEQLLQKLHNVRQVGRGKFMACCPAHGDHTASLSIREEDDGTILLHCFAGCPTVDVVAALGLPFSYLFPACEINRHARKSTKAPFNAFDVLAALCIALLEVGIYADQLSKGISLSETARQRLFIIAQRFHAAHTYISNRR